MMEKDFDIEVYIPEKRAQDRAEIGALEAAIEEVRTEAPYAIVECLTDVRFPIPVDWAVDLAQWPKGRLFSANFELRWEKISDGYQAVFVREKDFTIPEQVARYFTHQVSELEQTFRLRQETSFYLWLEKEPRLGRRLYYQCLDSRRDDSRQNIKLIVHQYYDHHGRLIFWRYKSMELSI
ncbi:MAG: hypothetical protein D6732_12370 [Methanobacteriota archaeon]|nr:MAG: hypothetical protein D6732_12370 [Euryarchaeota archaeon]